MYRKKLKRSQNHCCSIKKMIIHRERGVNLSPGEKWKRRTYASIKNSLASRMTHKTRELREEKYNPGKNSHHLVSRRCDAQKRKPICPHEKVRSNRATYPLIWYFHSIQNKLQTVAPNGIIGVIYFSVTCRSLNWLMEIA